MLSITTSNRTQTRSNRHLFSALLLTQRERMKMTSCSVFLTLLVSFISVNPMNAQNNTSVNQALDAKQQSLVTISALTAIGDLANLKKALTAGLDAGLTINEINEELVQLYAYCGFPRSLNGITTLMAVVDERKAKGIKDVTGRDATPVTSTANKYETGKKTLETLTGKEDKGPTTGANGFAPLIDTFLKEHLFADIFSRDVLNYSQRELVTIAALASLDGVESQLQAHMGIGLNVGITKAQLEQVLSLIETNVGKRQADASKQALSNVMNSQKK